MKRYYCKYVNCHTLLEKPGYCDKHKTEKKQSDRIPFENAKRSNDVLYHSQEWKILKKLVLKEQPYCWYCGISKEDAGILEVHHIQPPRGNPDLFFDRSNCISVCRDCHSVITAKEISDRKQHLNR